MTNRTRYKDDLYFEEYISESAEIVSNTLQRLSNGDVNKDRMDAVKERIFSESLHTAIACFSAGRSSLEQSKFLIIAVRLLESHWFYPPKPNSVSVYFDSYPKIIWMTTLMDFLRLRNELGIAIQNLIESIESRDWLLDYLFYLKKPQAETLIFPKPYATLKAAVEAQATDPKLASALVKRYLEKEWYKGHKDAYWYDNHKSKHDTFFGYWSFEAAAVVKIAGIDDSSFRDNEYYPKDLLG
jgi:hypothetical protein